MSRRAGPAVVIGLGNPLLGDDGVGLRVIDELRRRCDRAPASLPPDARLVAAGTPSLDLLPVVGDARALLVIDAIDAGRAPGSVTVARGRRVDPIVGRGAVGDLLVALQVTGHAPRALVLITIQAETTDPGVGLSTPVAAAVAEAADVACRELSRITAATSAAAPKASPSGPPAEVYA